MRGFVSFGMERNWTAQGVSGRFRSFHEGLVPVGDSVRGPCGMAARQAVTARPTLVELDRHHSKISLGGMRGARAWPRGDARRVSGNGHGLSGDGKTQSTGAVDRPECATFFAVSSGWPFDRGDGFECGRSTVVDRCQMERDAGDEYFPRDDHGSFRRLCGKRP